MSGTEKPDYDRSSQHNASDLRALQALASRTVLDTGLYAELAAFAEACLAIGCRVLRLDTGIIGSVQNTTYHVLYVHTNRSGIRPGDVFPLAQTNSAEVLSTRATVHFGKSGKNSEQSPRSRGMNTGMEAYVSAPIWVHGVLFGTLDFGDTAARPGGFAAADVELVETMAELLGKLFAAEQRDEDTRVAHDQRRERQEMLDMTFQHAIVGKAVVDVSTQHILEVNNTLCRMLGYSREALTAKTFTDITHPEDRNIESELFAELIAGHRASGELEKRYIRHDGQTMHAHIGVALVRSAEGKPRYLVAQLRDITAHKETERRLQEVNQTLERLSLTDSLTGVWNRRHFDQVLAQEFARAQRYGTPLSIAMLDLDRFKRLNDQFGHVAGDRILARIGELLRKQARAADVVARYGGEEFAIVLPHTRESTAYTIAERYRQAIAGHRWKHQPVTVSAGVATLDAAMATQRELVARADQALYAAKANGRNQTVGHSTHAD